MFLGRYSTFISFHLIILFIPLLNFSINSLSSYLLSLTILLNSCMNFSIVLLPCFIFFSSITSANSLSLLLKFFYSSVRKFPTIENSNPLLNPPKHFSSKYLLILFMLWDAGTLTIFLFLFFYFSNFILIFFFFSFLLFFFWIMKKAHDTAVT